MKVLIVDDEPAVLEYMKRVVREEGHEVYSSSDGRAALEMFSMVSPDMVFSDVQMPNMDGLELLREIRRNNPEAVVIITTGAGSETFAVEALRLGANNYLSKPARYQELVALIKKYDHIISERAVGREIEHLVVRRHLTLKIDNRLRLTTRVATFLVDEAGDLLPEEIRLDISLGLDELLTNAMEHGNLGITFEEKEAALSSENGMSKIYDARLADPSMAGRKVTVEFNSDGSGFFEWLITDEGTGFDWRAVPTPLEEGRLESPCGRGIFLSRMIFDDVEYKGKGNVVRVTKLAKK
ncbi:MAG: response regulator [Lentisphaerota bacterium]